MPQLKTPEEYARLAEHYAKARRSADAWSQPWLLALERSYRVLAESVRLVQSEQHEK